MIACLNEIFICIMYIIMRVLFLYLSIFMCFTGCNNSKNVTESNLHELPDQVILTYLPCDSNSILWMQPYGNVDHGGGNAFFHNGIDFGTEHNGAFYSCSNGYVSQIELNTGVGWDGTNYRITIQVSKTVILDYHFEIAGEVSVIDRKNNIFISEGDKVEAGQHIGNLIVATQDIAHVHWSIFENGEAITCPIDYFADDVKNSFESLYDSGIEKRPNTRPNLCE